jgi:alkylation response protein AidB-like acyl-CoA dehydrogenase
MSQHGESEQVEWDVPTLFAIESPSEQEFRREVRQWIDEKCPPGIRHRSARFTPAELKPWHRMLFDKGWIAPHWPREFGGMGGTVIHQLILYEEIGRAGAPVPLSHGLNLIGPLIIDVGTDAQRAQHLPAILSGDATWCQGYSEPGAGSDLASLSTCANLDGDTFVVNGHKTWTTNGHHADWMFALVRTDTSAQPRHAGISMLLIDMKSPGITTRPIRTLRGDFEFAEEFFDNVSVPKQNLLGNINQGWRLANRILGAERLLTGHPRLASRILAITRQVAMRSGARSDCAFCDRLATLEIELVAFAAYFRHGISLVANRAAPLSLAPTVRIAGAELAQRATELLLEAAGIEGASTQPLPTELGTANVAAELFEARRLTVGSGSIEIQKNIIAKRVLGLPSS